MNSLMDPQKRLFLSVAPYLHSGTSIRKIMLSVMGALCPAFLAGIYFFGLRSLFHVVTAVAFAVAAEGLIQKLRKVPVTLDDLSACVSGLLLALTMPPQAPLWLSAAGSVFAVAVVKQAFGGLGCNFMNPALAGRAFLSAAWPSAMTGDWILPRGSFTLLGLGAASVPDAVAGCTPLAAAKALAESGIADFSVYKEALLPLFIGRVGGCIGETSAIALLAGALFLLFKRRIPYRIPASFLASVFFLSWLANGSGLFFSKAALVIPSYSVLSGGLMLGAFFMATDPVTSPITPFASVLYGIGCGVLTVLIRSAGAYPEGVAFAILLMNIVAPLLEKVKQPRIYGRKRKKDEE